MTQPAPDLQGLKNRMRATWMAGDFGVIAKTNAGAGEVFANSLHVQPGTRVLDVACGTGNVAVPLARTGAAVTGVDIAPNLLAQARDRAAAESLSITFDEGDAEQLPYPDGSFDAVVTMFGAMFAPRPEVVAAELARVLKPGGLLAMANWTPGSFSGQMFRIGNLHIPPPPGILPPVLWGDPDTVRDRLAPHFDGIATQPVAMDFDLPMNPSETVAMFRKYFGPTTVAFDRLDEAGRGSYAAALETLWRTHNIAFNPATQTLIQNEYLQVTASRQNS